MRRKDRRGGVKGLYLKGLVLLTIEVVDGRVLVATFPVTLDQTQVLEGLTQRLVLGSDGSHGVEVKVGGGDRGGEGGSGSGEKYEEESDKEEKLEGRRDGGSICRE